MASAAPAERSTPSQQTRRRAHLLDLGGMSLEVDALEEDVARLFRSFKKRMNLSFDAFRLAWSETSFALVHTIALEPWQKEVLFEGVCRTILARLRCDSSPSDQSAVVFSLYLFYVTQLDVGGISSISISPMKLNLLVDAATSALVGEDFVNILTRLRDIDALQVVPDDGPFLPSTEKTAPRIPFMPPPALLAEIHAGSAIVQLHQEAARRLVVGYEELAEQFFSSNTTRNA